MPIAGYTTTVDASKTANEITGMLAKRGAARVTTDYDQQGNATGLSFELRTEVGVRAFALPIRAEGVLATLKRDRAEKRYLTLHQAERVAWRLVRDWLRAQLALIDAGSVSLDEIFFPWMVAPSGGTMHALFVEQQKAIGS
ncbi:hypothetical protein NS220_06060 [Microbacterium testaceum]|uniref:Uncharacterized protein n=1 Tax=Microbacterium testaceum TaxID=2033 RepID=A0A147EYS2_MICTE|nr:hypothetical protein [Microbacterium testaceum]KTR95365.1 hypothetical protein NS220_06060 [Microbacterium testaceum]